MKRRPFLQLFGVNLMSISLLPAIGQGLIHTTGWQAWLQQIVKNCDIETVPTLFCTEDLPSDKMVHMAAEFSKVTNNYYFYQQRQYCFTVFEKYHAVAGLLELTIPFWKRQSDGSWKKLTCLSLFELEALARAGAELGNQNGKSTLGDYLLPKEISKTCLGGYLTTKGKVNMITKIQENGVTTSICIKDKDDSVWHDAFQSAHCLTCQA